MLKNAYFLAKIGADTAENERHFAEKLPKIGNCLHGTASPGAFREAARALPADVLWMTAPRVNDSALSPRKAARMRDEQVRGVRVSKIRKFCKMLQIVGGLVLGCMKTKFCKKICI